MNAAGGNPGINNLANILQVRMRESAAAPPVFDFGVIGADLSLVTNNFPQPIPATDYLVCRGACFGKAGSVLTSTAAGQGAHPHGPSGEHVQEAGDGRHSHPGDEGTHRHDVVLPASMRSLAAGDRVLVAWVGNDAVVIDLIYTAARLGG